MACKYIVELAFHTYCNVDTYKDKNDSSHNIYMAFDHKLDKVSRIHKVFYDISGICHLRILTN